MSLRTIRFEDIRPHEGSQNTGFEELCCQLAGLEPRAEGEQFYRKGRGADAGVECYIRRADGTERGWQAKYVFQWDSSLAGQLDKSIRTALEKHPDLTEYVVCVPFDPPDARSGNGKSQLAKWQAWRSKWIQTAKEGSRSLVIELWSAHAIGERLSRDDTAYSGRLLYWFDKEHLSANWFKHQFQKSRAALGSRYVPKSNVELPIRKDFQAFVRDPIILEEVENWTNELLQRGHSAVNAVERASGTSIQPHSAEINSKVQTLVDAIASGARELDQALPITEWQEAAQAAIDVVRPALQWTLTVEDSRPNHSGSSPSKWARHELYKLSNLVEEISNKLGSQTWKLGNVNQLLLIGEAGSGKSHLLADVCAHQIERGAPAVLVLGHMLNDSEPWRQILTQLDLSASLQVKHFLGAMDAAAEAAGMRALVCVDALNERNGIDVWPAHLAAFLMEAERFPRVVVCVSCRTTYLPYILPKDLEEEAALPRVTHKGFGGTSGDAAKHYLDMRGIVRPGAPNLLPEFNNPLFLKTCCDYLEKEGQTELPRGLQGVTAIFDFYLSAASKEIDRRMKLDRRLRIVPTAVKALSEAFAKAGHGYLPFEDARTIFEGIHPSHGRFEASLLTQLESEGVLAVEPVRLADEAIQQMVRFTFERFSDHAIALHLFDKHLDSSNLEKSFAVGTPLFEVTAGADAHRRAGVVEAIAIQLPERAGVELPDMLPENSWGRPATQAFRESLLWREQSRFTQRTIDLVFKILGGTYADYLAIAIATEPKNPFNALHLHNKLSATPMPERDQEWSTFVADSVYESEGPIETLISWAFEQGLDAIDDDRAELAAITLTWFFSTSARVVRDRATKALAALLANRLPLAIKLLERFSNVDDLYVRERLLASIYGAVLQGTAPSGVEELAAAVYVQIFETGAPPVDALLRDHAAGVIHYARWRGKLPTSVDISKVGPPNASPWPIEFVPDALIETFKEDYPGGRYRDAIVGSAGLGGDFGSYILPKLTRAFCPVPIGTKLLRSSEVYQLWLSEFEATALDSQREAFVALIRAAKSASGQHGYETTPEKMARTAAEEAFNATLTSDAWEDFCMRARNYLYYGIFLDDWQNRSVANFDASWASKWIIKRAHDLGWTPERFGEFDRVQGHGSDRYDHRVERVGKKYQWLAFHELAARIADNLAYKGDIYADDGEPRAYRGALDVGLRDIDPSLLVHSTHFDGWRQWPRSWWVPVELSLGPQTPAERLAWRENNEDIINDSSLIDVTDPTTGRKWLVLHSFGSWTQSAVVDGSKVQQRYTWFRLECFVVRKKHAAKFETWLKGKSLVDRSRLPKLELHERHYLGEYPWHPALADLTDWAEPDEWNKLPTPIRQTVGDYRWEKGGYDYSLDESVSLQIPAPWLTEAMGLHLIDGRRLAYADDVGTIRFFDPSASRPGHQAALVDRDAFLKVLEESELEAVWVIAGEKSVFGGREPHRAWGGNLIHTTIYRLNRSGEFKASEHIEREEPSNDQMEEFLKA
jgi:hypothetical protein